MAGLRGHVGNTTEIGNGFLRSETEADALVGARVGGEGRFEAGLGGVTGEVKGEAFAGAEASVSQRNTALWGVIGNDFSVSAQAGAGASGEAGFHAGLTGVTASAHAEAWAGARAGVEDHVTCSART